MDNNNNYNYNNGMPSKDDQERAKALAEAFYRVDQKERKGSKRKSIILGLTGLFIGIFPYLCYMMAWILVVSNPPHILYPIFNFIAEVITLFIKIDIVGSWACWILGFFISIIALCDDINFISGLALVSSIFIPVFIFFRGIYGIFAIILIIVLLVLLKYRQKNNY